MAAGVGNKVQLKLGGKVCDRHGSTLDVEAYVKCITDGEFKLEKCVYSQHTMPGQSSLLL